MQKAYDKLVRDRIPEIIRAQGYSCEVETMNEEEYREALRKKIIEEACEVATAYNKELVTELADLYEVMIALMKTYEISPTMLRSEQEQRRAERGGFEQRTRLVTMSPANGSANGSLEASLD